MGLCRLGIIITTEFSENVENLILRKETTLVRQENVGNA